MKKNNFKYLILLLLLMISIGFAYVVTELGIFGEAFIKSNSLTVYWDNVDLLTENVGTEPIIYDDGTTISFGADFKEVGDVYSFKIDVVNDSNVDAKIVNLDKNIFEIIDSENKIDRTNALNCFEFDISHDGGTALIENQLLPAGEKFTYVVTVKYTEYVLYEDKDMEFSIAINYEVDDGTGVEVLYPVCKRAKTLHTEECTASGKCSLDGYAEGEQISFGNLGVEGEEPQAGDAYDCDVNGDGIYDPVTERFYYLGFVDNNDENTNVVLLYYTNVEEGNISDNYKTKFTKSNSYEAGPDNAYLDLPTTEQWSNKSLNKNISRQILSRSGSTDLNGTYNLPVFTYENRAAKIPSHIELRSACGGNAYKFGTNCPFLLENTSYTTYTGNYKYWTESPDYTSIAGVYNFWTVSGEDRCFVGLTGFNEQASVRPAIEVRKDLLKN